VEKPRKPNKLPKAITVIGLESLCEALRADYREKHEKRQVQKGEMLWRIPLFWFGLYTGMRRSELARMRWEHIDFERHLIYIFKQKNNKEQTIPLSKQARAVLSDSPYVRRGEPRDFVFRSPGFTRKSRSARNFGERASAAFRKAREKAGLPDTISFHSLRHGTATALAEAGKSAAVIKEVMRHADISTSLRYVHLANEYLKREVEGVF
jgi:integrase